MPARIAFVTYETPFAPAGGVAAVMGRLPAQVGLAAGLHAAIFTPFHYRITRTAALAEQLELVGSLSMPYQASRVSVNVLKLERGGTWYFIAPADQRFFAGNRHPYDVPPDPDDPMPSLLRDALFFGAAVARAQERGYPLGVSTKIARSIPEV